MENTNVWITAEEMEIINSFQYKPQRKVLFTLVSIAKYFNGKNSANNGWVNFDTKKIFRLANVSVNRKQQNLIIHEIYVRGLLEFPANPMNLNLRVTFICDEGEKIHEVKNIEDAGLSYLLFCGEMVKECAKCGRLFRPKSARYRICSNCKAKETPPPRFICCLDCGRIFWVSQYSQATIRCPECAERFRNARNGLILRS